MAYQLWFTTRIREEVVYTQMTYMQGDHSSDNVKFPDGLWHSSAALGMFSVNHIMPILALNTCMDANMQLTINSFRQLLPDKIFPDF